jgi:DNA-binding NtrC family response regulator
MKKEIKNEAYAELEIRFLENALNSCDWNISKTAEAVGIDRRLLQNMIKKHGIKRRRN